MQADVERFLARLLTDRDLRERFAVDPLRVGLAEGLGPDDAEMIARMPVQDLRIAGRSYDRKRNEVRKGAGRTWFAGWFSKRLR